MFTTVTTIIDGRQCDTLVVERLLTMEELAGISNAAYKKYGVIPNLQTLVTSERPAWLTECDALLPTGSAPGESENIILR